MGNKGKSKENAGPLLNEIVDLVKWERKKTEALNACFASAFTSKTGLQESQRLEVKTGARKMCPWWKRMRSGNT